MASASTYSFARREVVIVGGVRTPFARSGGVLEPLGAADLGRIALGEALAKSGVSAQDVDHVVLGCAGMPSDAANVARVAALRAGVPVGTPAVTVQRNCGSGLEAVAQAALLVESGAADVVLCGGTESMTNYAAEFPRSFRRKMMAVQRARGGLARALALARLRPRDFAPEWGLKKGLTDPTCGLDMGQTAEVLAREMGITRAEQDAFAVLSHRRAAAAREKLAEETVPVVIDAARPPLVRDDAVREDQSLEKLAKLRPAFARSHGTVTPGNACGITDGACGIVIASREWALRHAASQGPATVIRSITWAGVAPERMGLGPAAALPDALEKSGWSLGDLDLVEINEAFAAQVIACLRVMDSDELSRAHAGRERRLGAIDPARLNVNGGAIALGHPVGVSGARLVLTLWHELRRRDARRAAASLCIGGGQGMAMLLERG